MLLVVGLHGYCKESNKMAKALGPALLPYLTLQSQDVSYEHVAIANRAFHYLGILRIDLLETLIVGIPELIRQIKAENSFSL